MNKPQILFLDEPTQGIDIGAKNEIYDIIDTLAKSGVSIVMVSSEMQETIRLCDRIVILYEGRVTGEVTHEEATGAAHHFRYGRAERINRRSMISLPYPRRPLDP